MRLAHMGQGVCFEAGQDRVTFIAGALPGETLTAELHKVLCYSMRNCALLAACACSCEALATHWWHECDKNLMPDDQARVSAACVMPQVKKSFAEGSKIAVVTPAPASVKAPCPHYSACGGCALQELRYDAQLSAKASRLLFELDRQAGLGTEGAAQVFEGSVPCAEEFR